MNLNPLSPIIEKSLESMFFLDKQGYTIFFPLGLRGKGYIVADQDLRENLSKFYTSSFTIYLIVALALFIIFHSSLSFVVIFGWSICYLIVLRLYINRITESLPVASSSYVDILFDKNFHDEEEIEDKNQPHLAHPVPANHPAPQPEKYSLFRRLRLFLYPLSSGVWSSILWLGGIAIAMTWNTFHPVQYSTDRAEGLTFFIVIFFFGLGYLIYAIKGDPFPGRLSNPWFAVILSLGLSLVFLYIFIIGK